MNIKYTDEKNVLILMAYLKKLGIRKIVASPGTTNYSFVGSLQSDSYFEMYSSVDERSAAYIACGLAAQSGEPVVLTCTGATASRNYYPGLTEAFYRKLPILAITSHQGKERIGQLVPQNIDRSKLPNDIVCLSVDIPIIKDSKDYEFACREINRALLELHRNGGGPVHINYTTTYSRNFETEELPDVRLIQRYYAWDSLPEIPKGRTGIFVGSHRKFSEQENVAIERFCATHDAVVFCDHTSGYYGKYRILPTVALMQDYGDRPLEEIDLMIHIGEVSGAVFSGAIKGKDIWRVNPDGEIRDTYKRLTKVFQMSEDYFFNHYSKEESSQDSFLNECKVSFAEIYKSIPELPFSNIWIAQHLSPCIPNNSIFHISASHSRRAWNMFPFLANVETMCNVGVCGIDGCTSTLIGASLAEPKRLCYLVTGDLAFFYDLNVLGNRHIDKNVRILLINNGIGGEFKLNGHPCYTVGEYANPYMAAEGHFGCKSPMLIKHFAQDLGFEYITASDKISFLTQMEKFVNPEVNDKPMVFEVFTDYHNEDEALKIIKNLNVNSSGSIKLAARHLLGDKGVNKLKSILKR